MYASSYYYIRLLKKVPTFQISLYAPPTSRPVYLFTSVAAYKSQPEVNSLPILTLSLIFVMSQTSLHLVGDSNVVRYLPLVKSVKDDPFYTRFYHVESRQRYSATGGPFFSSESSSHRHFGCHDQSYNRTSLRRLLRHDQALREVFHWGEGMDWSRTCLNCGRIPKGTFLHLHYSLWRLLRAKPSFSRHFILRSMSCPQCLERPRTGIGATFLTSWRHFGRHSEHVRRGY